MNSIPDEILYGIAPAQTSYGYGYGQPSNLPLQQTNMQPLQTNMQPPQTNMQPPQRFLSQMTSPSTEDIMNLLPSPDPRSQVSLRSLPQADLQPPVYSQPQIGWQSVIEN